MTEDQQPLIEDEDEVFTDPYTDPDERDEVDQPEAPTGSDEPEDRDN
jgi:hypothetical protein